MERRTERQLICGKRKCRNGLQGGQSFGRYHAPSNVVSTPRSEPKPGIKTGTQAPPSWHLYRGGIAGPAKVIQVEVIRRRDWHEVVSPDGVCCQVTRYAA
jgi:hypothetical protein